MTEVGEYRDNPSEGHDNKLGSADQLDDNGKGKEKVCDRFPSCCCSCHITRGMAVVYVLSLLATLAFVTPWLFHHDVLPTCFVISAIVNTSVMTVACILGMIGLKKHCARASSGFFIALVLNILVSLAEIGLFVYIVCMPPEVESRYRGQWEERYGDQPEAERITFEKYRTLNQARILGIYVVRNLGAICLSIYFLYAASILRRYLKNK